MRHVISQIFDEMCLEYTDLLKNIYPSRDSKGFTERNLTYRFCKLLERKSNFSMLSSNSQDVKVFSWMEFPLEPHVKDGKTRKSHPHIDAVTFAFGEKEGVVCFVESKRITEGNYDQKYKSILRDFYRVQCPENRSFIIKRDYLYEGNSSLNYSQFIVYLADVWVGNKDRSNEVETWWCKTLPENLSIKGDSFFKFKKIKKYSKVSYNLLIGYIEVPGS